MGADEIIRDFERELIAAEDTLNNEYSFELAEPNYLRCLKIIRSAPHMTEDFTRSMIRLYDSKAVSDEPLAYLMHVLKWPKVASWAEERLRALNNPIATGASLEKILAAYDDDWENREFYAHL